MEVQRIDKQAGLPGEGANFLLPALVLFGLIFLLLAGFGWFVLDLGSRGHRYYLLPWCLLTAIILLSPSIYLAYKKEFDPFHPLVFGVWSYMFPAFVIGGVILTFGWSDPYYLTFVEDPSYNLPLSLAYVCLGYLGLTAGFAVPIGRWVATKVERYLPRWNWPPEKVWLPGLVLVAFGIGFSVIAFLQGLLGFQRVDDVGIYDGLLFFLVMFLTEGTLLLWLGIFTVKQKTGIYYVVLAAMLLLIPMKMGLQGNRGSLLSSLIPIGLAFQYSKRRLKARHSTILGVILLVAVFIGMIYGTAFRNIKGSEARTSTGDYVGQVLATIDYLSAKDTGEIISESFLNLAERVENLSSLGVAVANYEKLAPYEASFGIEDNIISDLYVSLIPRFIWADKPPTSDARAYSDLYFNYSENSFAVTPFGDLLRNFGPIGVPLGMFIVGIYFRWIYAQFIKTETQALWKKVAYYLLLIVVSYEGFYASIFPTFVRTAIVLLVSLALAKLLINQLSFFSKGRYD